jgi:response regulator RpfG family c-di-GMP phosphodiesterase
MNFAYEIQQWSSHGEEHFHMSDAAKFIELYTRCGSYGDRIYIEWLSRSAGCIARDIARRNPQLLTSKEAQLCCMAAPLCDIGGLFHQEPSGMAGPFASDCTDGIRMHIEKGLEVIEKVKPSFTGCDGLFHQVQLIIQYHHERYDGCGKPYGLSGEAVPLCANIVSLCNFIYSLAPKVKLHIIPNKEILIRLVTSENMRCFHPVVVDSFLTSSDAVLKNAPGLPSQFSMSM